MCSAGSVPFSKNSSISASLPSAMISTRASCAALRGLGQSAGMSVFLAFAVAIRRIHIGFHVDEIDRRL